MTHKHNKKKNSQTDCYRGVTEQEGEVCIQNQGNYWYNTDGSKYGKEFRFEEDSVKEVELEEKVKELEDKLKRNMEVIIHCMLCYVM